MDLTTLIPQPWLDAAAAWAPYVLAVLILTTALVHALLPLARAVEDWANTTAVTWDDSAARRAVEILEWLAGFTALLLPLVPRLAMGGLAPKGGTKTSAPKRPPSSGALALVLVVMACSSSMLTSGCGASALQVHVEVAAGFEDSSREAALIVRTFRTDAMRAAARAVHDAGGSEQEAIAAARAKAEELEPLVEAQRLYALATHAYVDALWLAEHSSDGLQLSDVLPALRDLLDAYRHVRELGEALDVEQLAGLPDTPAFLDGAVPPQLLASSGSQEGGAR